ncbi:MAG: hypothetical protein IH946_09930 [Bacteroidetes bacterium]|nr:hypothetical protein [Bacteroidota bacterium]
MKRCLPLILLILTVSKSFSQTDGSMIFSVRQSTSVYGSHGFSPDVSFELQYFVDEHVSLNYSIAVSHNYIHMPVSVPLAILTSFCLYYYIEDLYYMFLLPEGVGFHFKLNDMIALSPYVNPLGMDVYYYGDYYEQWALTGAIGMKLYFNLDHRFYASPYAEYKIAYNYSGFDLRAGIAAGFRFR